MHVKDTVQKLQKGSLCFKRTKLSQFPHLLLYFSYWWLLLHISDFSPHVFVILAAYAVPTFMLLATLSKAFRSCMAAEWLFLWWCSHLNLTRAGKQTSSKNSVWLLLISNFLWSFALSQIYNAYMSDMESLLANTDRMQRGFANFPFSGRRTQ